MAVKLCRDCFFYVYGECIKHYHERLDLVTGETVSEPPDGWHTSPTLERGDDFLGMLMMNTCGKVGRFWKARK